MEKAFWLKLLSLLLWERGLKYMLCAVLVVPVKSLLLWERGLKLLYLPDRVSLRRVAPLVGAWIEITVLYFLCLLVLSSLLLWERGLKYLSQHFG